MQAYEAKCAFANLRTYRKGAYVAPHKALMLLIMMGRCWSGAERLVLFSDIADPFMRLLHAFDVREPNADAPRKPFWALISEHCAGSGEPIWELQSVELAEEIKQGPAGRPLYSRMLNSDLHGGFSKQLHSLIASHKLLQLELAFVLLDEYFPKHLHASLLLATGIGETAGTLAHPTFRERVLQSYRFSCAVCGTGDAGEHHSDVQVAHIQWPFAGGPDRCANALALCALHRELFDFGAFTLSDRGVIDVSGKAAAGDSEQHLRTINRKQLALPEQAADRPGNGYIKWHRRHVYRSA